MTNDLTDSLQPAPIWRRALYRLGLALNSELEEAERALMYARGDLRQNQSRFQAMQHEIDELKQAHATARLAEHKARKALRELLTASQDATSTACDRDANDIAINQLIEAEKRAAEALRDWRA